jgi:hypothetical protein
MFLRSQGFERLASDREPIYPEVPEKTTILE